MRELERYLVLQVVDNHWKEQLHAMDVLRQGIGLRGYGQRNPLQEYSFEAFNLFEEMKSSIRLNVSKLIFRVQVQTEAPLRREERPRAVSYDKAQTRPGAISNTAAPAAAAGLGAVNSTAQPQGPVGATRPIRADAKVGRNDPCPCGSGKKFKHCHGREVGAVSGD
jgi:preprotein translocase subunit SecA